MDRKLHNAQIKMIHKRETKLGQGAKLLGRLGRQPDVPLWRSHSPKAVGGVALRNLFPCPVCMT